MRKQAPARGLSFGMRVAAAVVALGLCAVAAPARAHGPSQPLHQQYRIGDFKLESGELITDFSISFVTHGALNAQRSSAVLVVTAIGGNHHRIDFLIGPGRALDPSRYFIVATDAIGNGLTTSPSSSVSQSRMQFPRFSIRDMVESQRRLLAIISGSSTCSPSSARRWAECRRSSGA